MSSKNSTLNQLEGIELFIFPFEDCDTPSLEKIGRQVLLPTAPKREGKSTSRMRSYWAGRATLAIAFKRLGIEAFVQPETTYGYLQAVDRQGRPIPALNLNISHTESIVAAVLAPSAVGVDIEVADRDASKVISRVASESEVKLAKQGVYASNGKSLNPNIALWSAKEAAAKAVGLGMKFGLSCFEIVFTKDDVYRVRSDKKGPVYLKSPSIVIESFAPYIISVCSELELISSGRIGRSLVSSFDLS